MHEDMDIDAGRIIENLATLDDVGEYIYDLILETAQGNPTVSEALGHQEFVLTYKSFEPSGPSFHPG